MKTLNITEAKNWLMDAFPNQDPEEIKELTDKEILIYLNKYYEGGVEAFIIACS